MADKPGAIRGRGVEVGQVVSRSGNKSIVVVVTRRKRHPLYERYVNQRKKFHAHDEQNQCQVGDWVRIVPSRRLSRQKSWRLREIIARGAQPPAARGAFRGGEQAEG
jgi:small subunit ribosomal protein S17